MNGDSDLPPSQAPEEKHGSRRPSRDVVALFGFQGVIIAMAIAVGGAIFLIAHTLQKSKSARAAEAAAAHPATVLRPATHSANAEVVHDAGLDFTFDLPPGFHSLPEGSRLAGYAYQFTKSDENTDGLGPVLLIKRRNEVLPPRHMTTTDLPKGKELSLTTFDWRGLEVDAVRVPEEAMGEPYLTFNVILPLKKGGVQFGFGDLAKNENALRERVIQTLATLDGETNW